MNHKNVFQAPTIEPPYELTSSQKTTEQTTSITSGIEIIPSSITTTPTDTTELLSPQKTTEQTTSTSTYTTAETPEAEIWITVVSVVAVLIVLAIIGLSIFLYIRKKHSTTKEEFQRSFHSERSYDLPYKDQVYDEYEQYEDGLYENYQN